MARPSTRCPPRWRCGTPARSCWTRPRHFAVPTSTVCAPWAGSAWSPWPPSSARWWRSGWCPEASDRGGTGTALRTMAAPSTRMPCAAAMPVHLTAPHPSDLHPVPGLRLGIAEAGVRKANRKDLVVLELAEGSAVAGVFTQNRYCAAPVQVCREHLASGAGVRAVVINTGNANAGTGADGLARARRTCDALAGHLGLKPQQVLPFSTGVIMETLPVERIEAGLPAALADLSPSHWVRAAEDIMTTDTLPKGAADASFNRITIDGDTSTNDSFLLIATRQAGHPEITSLDSAEGAALREAVFAVSQQLAQAIVRDGEGATKFITIRIEGGRTEAECQQVAYAIAHSPLVKTAFFASDPNLGRILAAVGYAGVSDLDQSLIEMHLDEVHVVTQGGRHPAYREEDGQRVMKQAEITVRVALGRGTAQATVWTCDLSPDYVSINADYRS